MGAMTGELLPGCAWDSTLAAENPGVAALVRAARRMREAAHRCKVGAARRRAAGCSTRLVREQEDLSEALCHAESAIRTEVQHLTGLWPVDDQPAPDWPADLTTPAPRPPAPAPLALFEVPPSARGRRS